MQPTNRRAFERDRALARLSRLTSLTAVASVVGTVGFGGLAALNFRGTVTTSTDTSQTPSDSTTDSTTDPYADTTTRANGSGQSNTSAQATNPPITQLEPVSPPVRTRSRTRSHVVTGGSG